MLVFFFKIGLWPNSSHSWIAKKCRYTPSKGHLTGNIQEFFTNFRSNAFTRYAIFAPFLQISAPYSHVFFCYLQSKWTHTVANRYDNMCGKFCKNRTRTTKSWGGKAKPRYLKLWQLVAVEPYVSEQKQAQIRFQHVKPFQDCHFRKNVFSKLLPLDHPEWRIPP